MTQETKVFKPFPFFLSIPLNKLKNIFGINIRISSLIQIIHAKLTRFKHIQLL